MPSLSEITSSPMLREFAQGAAQSAVQPVADFLAPTVEVPTSIGRYKIYTEKNRFLPPDTARAIGGRATVLSFDATDSTYNCQPNALDFPIDFLEQIEEASRTNALMEGATIVAEVAALAHEQNVINSALAATTSTAHALTWSGNSGTDPIDDLDEIAHQQRGRLRRRHVGDGIVPRRDESAPPHSTQTPPAKPAPSTPQAHAPQTAPSTTWSQWLSGLAAFHKIPVYNYGVAASTCVGTSRMLAGTATGGGYQNDYFYNGTEYENGTVVGTIAGVASLPASHMPSIGSGGIAYFVETHDGGNESGQGIPAGTYATDELANFATMRGYGSNVKVIGFCGPQGIGYNLGTLYPYATYARSWLGSATGLDALVDLGQVFTDPTNGTFFYTDNLHFTSQGYYNVALMVQNAILNIGNPTTPPATSALLGQSNIFNAPQSINVPGAGSQQVLGVYEPGLGTGGNYIYGLFGVNSGLDNSLGWSFTYYGPGNVSNQAHFALAGAAPGGLSIYNWGLSATGTLAVAGPVDPAIAPLATAGSTSGTVTWVEPFQGSAFKEVVATMSSNFAGTAALVFPAAFTNKPIVLNNDVAATTVGTGSIVLTGTGTLPRTVVVEGF